ncbi:hypothetical protein F1642_07720 [Paracoccus sp. NBH48]|uniref:hypothetical protein n=1 Tax=Paracoccus sp. NBH48 TaxID=2596918 RepID=UPI001890F676|nr:hypothetical protein [Paracoccus sp. NBH48]MBF5078973.1 hypothetical protein [Paracoccus sp. NBH48]
MKKTPEDFPGQAFLELLRPPKLTRTRFALFAAYSADPIVLGGALLNLHARGRDNAGGTKQTLPAQLRRCATEFGSSSSADAFIAVPSFPGSRRYSTNLW